MTFFKNLNFLRKRRKYDKGIKFYNISENKINFFNYKDSFRILVILVVLFISIFIIAMFFDKYGLKELFQIFLHPNSQYIVGNLLANAGGQIDLGLFAIAMTVVAIIVQLAANRYTDRVSDLFVRDKINILFLILLTFTSLILIVTLFLSRDEKIPVVLINISVLCMIVSTTTLVPYYIYVFKFLEPTNIISKIEKDILKNTLKARSVKINNYQKLRLKIDAIQLNIVHDIDQLTDIVLNSIEKKDKVLATNCIKSLNYFITDYILLKNEGRLVSTWYFPSSFVRYNNADFVTLTDESFELILKEKTWLEHKLFMQFMNIFQESLNIARDICNFTAQSFYSIGKHAINVKDRNVVLLVIKIFNTMLRATLNASDLRTCFNLLNQYKLFTISLIEAGEEKLVLEIVNYFKYYGLVAKNAKNMPFILETVAHDLCDICKKAYLEGLDEQSEILNLILTVDEPLDGEREEASLRGIRKAQIILAVFYLSINKIESIKRARKIFNDFLDEIDRNDAGYEKIYTIIKELKYLKALFWEIIDRGLNIDYIEDSNKKYLQEFQDWINLREIIKYSNFYVNDEKKKADDKLKNIYLLIKSLPKEVPIEIKEFENIYGLENLDIQSNYYQRMLSCADSLTDKTKLKNELEELTEFKNISINDKFLNSLIQGVKEFEKGLKSKFKDKIKI